MIGYLDTLCAGAHVVYLEVAVPFGADGVCWEPSPKQQIALAANAQRRARFQRIESEPIDLAPYSAPQEAIGPEPAPADPTGPTDLDEDTGFHVKLAAEDNHGS